MSKGGVVTKTISLPIYLQPIIQKLSSQRILSSTIASMLWEMYGEDEITEQEAVISTMKQEAQRLLDEANKKEKEISRQAPKREFKKKLSYLTDWLSENAASYRATKAAIKSKAWHITNVNRKAVEAAKIAINRYGDEAQYVEVYEMASQEAQKVRELMMNDKDDTDISYNNNNNNIYYLINYYYRDVETTREVSI